MLLTAVVAKAELVALVASMTPLRVRLDASRGRSVTIGRPAVGLVPGRGVRLRGNARLAWEVAGITVPVTLQGWQVLLVPKVIDAAEGRSLAFEPRIEELGLRMVPSFVDDKITDALADWVRRYETKLAWRFARLLTRRWPLSPRITPHETFELEVMGGDVEVTADELRLAVRLDARVARKASASAERVARAATEAEARPPASAPEGRRKVRRASASPSGTRAGTSRRRRSSPRGPA